MYENLHIHERLNAVLNILNDMPVKGFEQSKAVYVTMAELAQLDQDIKKAEQEEKDGQKNTAE